MSDILIRLRGKKFVEFSELFDPDGGVAELVVAFLALLELIRDRQVEVVQHRIFGMIYVSPIEAIESA
jgi:segregation and condensation protein A